ncbi:MAG: hypothetical protein C5B54_05935 [Acidobacteria bacterium]|nr:MAG: hypothetical protein C5B54_05935 [Acidobacteriota bacterium]
MSRISIRRILVEKEFWILFLLGLIYFYRPLFFGESFFFRDLYNYYLPHKELVADLILHHHLPLWDPYFQGGQPLLANVDNAVLYPSTVLYLILPSLTAFNWDIVLHVIFCSAAMYLLARILGIRPIFSVIAGLIFAYSGIALSSINLFLRLRSLPYLPLLLLFWHLYLLEQKKKWFILAVTSGMLQIFAGGGEISIITILIAGGWTLFFEYSQIALVKRVAKFLLLFVFIIGCSAIQLIPMGEMVAHSQRDRGIKYEKAVTWSLNPKRLPEFFLPEYNGQINSLSHKEYWIQKIEDTRYPYFLNIYWGCLAIILTLASGIAETKKLIPGAVKFFLLFLFIFGVVFSLGRFLPFFRVLFETLPLLSLFRYPIKFLYVSVLPVSLLPALLCESEFESRDPRKLLTLLWAVSVGLTVLTISLFIPDFSERFQAFFYGEVKGILAEQNLIHSSLHALGIFAAATILMELNRRKNNNRLDWLIASIFAIDLLLAGYHINAFAPREILSAQPAVAPIVKKEIDHGRLFRKPTALMKLNAPSDDIIWGQQWDHETLNHFFGANYQIPVIYHEDIYDLEQRDLRKLSDTVQSLPWARRMPLLTAGGVKMIITEESAPASLPEMRFLASIATSNAVPTNVFVNEKFAGRVWIVGETKIANDSEDSLKAMLAADFDPTKTVILENKLLEPTSSCKAKADLVEDDFSRSAYEVETGCNVVLVFAEPDLPGWHITLNGNPQKILHANAAFSAIFVPTGKYHVERFYQPRSVFIGAVVSILFVVLLICVGCISTITVL